MSNKKRSLSESVSTDDKRYLRDLELIRAARSPAPYAPKRAMPEGYGDLQIVWTMRSSSIACAEYGHIEKYLQHYRGSLRLFVNGRDDDEKYDEDEGIEIGYVKATKINRGHLCNEGGSVVELCDTVSQELYEAGELVAKLDNYSDSYDSSIANEVGDAWEISQGSALFVEKIFVQAEYRGLGFGLYLLDQIDDCVNDRMSLTLLKAAPLTEAISKREDESQAAFGARVRAAVKKLKELYALLGFKRLGDDDFVARWNGYVTPSLKDVCPHLWSTR